MISHLLSEGGSSVGLSYYQNLMVCPRRARLERELQESGEKRRCSFGQAVGILTHAFMELYETGVLPRDVASAMVKFGPDDHPALGVPGALKEASRLIDWWRLVRTPEYFGSLVGAEYPLEATPELCTYLGVPALTGRCDQVSEIDEFTAAKLGKDYLIDIEPGLYIIDLKCLEARRLNKYIHGHQATAYQLMWNAQNPDRPVKGFLLHFLIKTKTPDSKLHLVPPPEEAERESLRAALGLSIKYRNTVGEDSVNPWACINDWDQVCPFYENGMCDRHPGVPDA